MDKIMLRTNADTVAYAAPLIGFAPTNSIVVYMLGDHPDHGTYVRCAIRFDVTVSLDQARNLARTCNLADGPNDAAILLAVCDPGHDVHAGAVLDAVRESLHRAAIPVRKRLLTRTVSAPGQWLDIDTGERGLTYPYTDSALTAALVTDGRHIGHSRADLAAEFSPIDPAPTIGLGDINQLVAQTTDEITAILAGERTPSADLATRAGVILSTDPAQRDRMLRLTLGHERAASQLWTHLARQLRGRPRDEALTVAAVAYTLHGDSVRATIALEVIRHETDAAGAPPPQLAVLLDAALQQGTHPDKLRDIIASLPSDPPAHT